MSAYSDLIDTYSPRIYYRMGDSASPLSDETFNRDAVCFNSPTFDVLGAIDGDVDTAVTFNGTNQYAKPTLGYDLFPSYAAWSIACWVKFDANTNNVFELYASANLWINLSVDSATGITAATKQFATTHAASATGVDFSDWRLVVMTWSAGVFKLYVDDTLHDTDTDTNYTTWFSGSLAIWIARGNAGGYYAGSLDELAFLPSALDASDVADLYAFAPLPTVPAASVPMALAGFLSSAAASLAMRLNTIEAAAAGSLPLTLEAGDPSHYRGTVAAWAPQVILDGTDITDQLVGQISIEHAENESGDARFSLLPDPGAIDLGDYERKAVAISFVGKSDAGTTLYSVRRFTGITTTAVIDPDAGELTVSATTDLQGRLEQLDRDQLTQLIGGQWSEHVFDDTSDGYQYALDRLSTLAQAIDVDVYGRLRLTDWAAKATADVELTDAHRFGNTLNLSRANRRDLLTRVVVNIDFRFARLRHRAVDLYFWDALGFCHYLDNGWRAPSKDMVRAAADGSAWTRTSAITFIELPAINPSVCSPPRAWAGGADLFCLGANWTAARRWAQTITEEYTLSVVASDLETAIGTQVTNADYGLAATYDATDYEAQTDFSGPPSGSSYDSGLDDWVLAADDSEADGRSALEDAIACALAKARVEILGRARKNRVRLSNVYDPSLTLDKTLRVNTPYLVAKGKLARITERLDLTTGEPRQSLEIALSRHGGAGLAVDDTLTAPSAPSAPAESPTARILYLPYRLGATEFSAVDDPDWDGYMTNVAAGSPIYDGAGETYRDRFVVRMPEIEESARDAVSAQAPQSFDLIVPQDELTVSN